MNSVCVPGHASGRGRPRCAAIRQRWHSLDTRRTGPQGLKTPMEQILICHVRTNLRLVSEPLLIGQLTATATATAARTSSGK